MRLTLGARQMRGATYQDDLTSPARGDGWKNIRFGNREAEEHTQDPAQARSVSSSPAIGHHAQSNQRANRDPYNRPDTQHVARPPTERREKEEKRKGPRGKFATRAEKGNVESERWRGGKWGGQQMVKSHYIGGIRSGMLEAFR